MKIHVFGEYNQWAISTDDGCLRFHPQYNEHPEKTSTWIWKEAFDEVQKLGGYTAVVLRLRGYNDSTNKENIMCILEDIQERACKLGFPNKMSLSDFTDYIRGLYPEFYKLRQSEPSVDKPIKNILTEPVKHNLSKLFRALRYGRTAADQKYLTTLIDELERDDG